MSSMEVNSDRIGDQLGAEFYDASFSTEITKQESDTCIWIDLQHLIIKQECIDKPIFRVHSG